MAVSDEVRERVRELLDRKGNPSWEVEIASDGAVTLWQRRGDRSVTIEVREAGPDDAAWIVAACTAGAMIADQPSSGSLYLNVHIAPRLGASGA